MAIQIIGPSGNTADVNPDKSLFVEIRPPAITTLGVYNLVTTTGAIAATLAANSTLLAVRWMDATRFAIIRYVRCSAFVASTITTGVNFDLALLVARAFTASDTGGTALTPLGTSNKMRTSMGSSLMGDVRAATTGTLTPGTRTLDSNPMGRIQGFTGTALGTAIFGAGEFVTTLDRSLRVGAYPLVLANNEGLVIQNPLAGPATGTITCLFEIEWSEVPSY